LGLETQKRSKHAGNNEWGKPENKQIKKQRSQTEPTERVATSRGGIGAGSVNGGLDGPPSGL